MRSAPCAPRYRLFRAKSKRTRPQFSLGACFVLPCARGACDDARTKWQQSKGARENCSGNHRAATYNLREEGNAWVVTAPPVVEDPLLSVSNLSRTGICTRWVSTKSTPSAVSVKSELSARVMYPLFRRYHAVNSK